MARLLLFFTITVIGLASCKQTPPHEDVKFLTWEDHMYQVHYDSTMLAYYKLSSLISRFEAESWDITEGQSLSYRDSAGHNVHFGANDSAHVADGHAEPYAVLESNNLKYVVRLSSVPYPLSTSGKKFVALLYSPRDTLLDSTLIISRDEFEYALKPFYTSLVKTDEFFDRIRRDRLKHFDEVFQVIESSSD